MKFRGQQQTSRSSGGAKNTQKIEIISVLSWQSFFAGCVLTNQTNISQ
jgi:hypothetical protein